MKIVKKLTSWKFAKFLMIVFNFFASICSIIGFIYTLFSPKIKNVYSWIWIIASILFGMGFVAICLLFKSEKNDKVREELIYLMGIHTILHQLRDFQQDLSNIHERKTNMNKYDFIEKITSNCMEVMNIISKILGEITHEPVRACLKLNAFTKEDEDNPQNIKLITFARSGNLGIQAALKEQNKEIELAKNTDYEYIYNIKEGYEEDRDDIFYEKDLKKCDRKLRKASRNKEFYKNSDKKWKSKYNTTIVLPIRYLKDLNDEEAIYDILGFLCVDSKRAGAFERDLKTKIEFLKGISDILYNYLIDSVNYYKELKEGD